MNDSDAASGEDLVLALGAAWSALERAVNAGLGSIRGISLAEYRLLRALADAPRSRSSRVELARAVGLTPSAVTRALRPLEDLGFIATVKNERDARLALAMLTPAGEELVADASSVVRDTMSQVLRRAPQVRDGRQGLLTMLGELAQS